MIITRRQQRLRSRWRWVGRAFFAVSVVLLGYVALVFVQAELAQARSAKFLARQTPQDSPRAESEPAHPLAEGDILGRIKVSRLGLSAVILEGTTPKTLRRGVGHIRGTSVPGQPGNSAIAGHRDIFFRSLKGIHPDDEIELETKDGSTRYQVDWARVVSPEDMSVLDATSEPSLTLVTCYPFYFIGAAPKRFVVRAHQVTAAPVERTRQNDRLRDQNQRRSRQEECNEAVTVDRNNHLRVGNRIVLRFVPAA